MNGNLNTSFGIARSLLVYYGQPWRRRALKRFYREMIQPGDLVFDIGAHVGNRAKSMVSLGAKVVAVEPQPVFADLLEKILAEKLNGLERCAVGAEEGMVTLQISSLHPTVSSTSSAFVDGVRMTDGFRQVTWDRGITVPMTTLDVLIDHYGMPAFCKIDCEGAEADILKGLSKPIRLVAFEYTPVMPTLAFEAIKRLGELGSYKFNRVIGESHKFVETGWKDGTEMRRDLANLSTSSPFGDVYARLES
nr:FkbM family methyltransferase [uncultured Cohaesibacter sp.]